MKRMLTAVALISGLSAVSAYPAERPNSGAQFNERQMQMHNDQMEVHLKDMEALMDKLHNTKNASERERLLKEHRKQMQELMRGMKSSRDDMVMGMMSGGPRHGEPMPDGEKRRQYLIEKRLDMMDNAMEMMMRRDEMMMNRR